jgi:beta-glucosidase
MDQQDKIVYASPSNDESTESVVDRWLSEMSLAEQIGQMSQIEINMLLEDDGKGGKRLSTKAMERYIGEMAIGSVLNSVSSVQWSARQYREAAIALNQVAARYHRPPVIWGLDSVHGANYIKNAILTPQLINIAATWNSTAAFVAGELASRDTRAAGIHWLFSPLVGLATEPRWSRVYETFGEDPLLTGDMAKAMIDGIQRPDDSSIPSRSAACAKHFIGYSMPRTGHDRSPSWIPTRHLYQYFVPPWKRALMDNGAKTVMESYTETDGVPMAGNSDKLNYLLRNRLNFTGVLVTDYEEIRNLHNWHHIAPSDQDAIIYALKEGSVDVSMIPWDANGFATSIVAGIQSRQLSPDRIRESAARVLALKESLNMFEEMITIVEPNMDLVGTDEDSIMHVVHESIILAENKNSLLPLNPNRSLKIHVTGPTANSLAYQSGGWTWQWQGSPSDDWFTYGSTVVDALRNLSTWTVSYTCGVDVLGKECDDPDENDVDENIIDQVKHWVGLTPTTSIARAVEGAKLAEVTIVCLGEESYTEKPGDIRSLRLPDGQYDLIHAISRNADTKIVVIYFGGRPRLLADIVEEVDAVILGFLPGPSAGIGVIDIISGKINPSGRLPITYPSSDDGGGSPYWHAVTEQCTEGEVGTTLPHYGYVPCDVQWQFGHGLSYTSFEYSDFSVTGGIDEDLQIQIIVKNAGSRAGSDTVMFFTFDEFRRTTPEYKRLRAFEKVILQPGESKTLRKVVSIDTLQFVGPDDDTHYIIDPLMTSYLGAGYMVDCRRTDNSNNPATNKLCKRMQSRESSKPYFPACKVACDMWYDSKCNINMTRSICSNLCMSSSEYGDENDGWGWSYVNCIERVLWRMQKDRSNNKNCVMMTALCRDIFQTNISFSGLRAPEWPSNSFKYVHTASLSIYVAFTSCLLSTIIILLAIRGRSSTKRFEASNKSEENFRGIQFTVIANSNHRFD